LPSLPPGLVVVSIYRVVLAEVEYTRMIREPELRTTRIVRRPALTSRVVAILGVLIVVALAIPSFNGQQVGTFIDDANYIVTARGLATGFGFAQINYPDNRPEDHYPPGFPILLAPLAAVAGDAFGPLQIFSIVMTVVGLTIWYTLYRIYLSHFWSSVALLMLCANAVVMEFAPLVMSEALFLTATAGLLLLTIKLDERKIRSPWAIVALTVLALACLFIKTAGLAFGFAVVGHLAFRARYRAALVIAVVLLAAFGLWTARNLTVTGTPFGPTYGQELSDGVHSAGRSGPLGVVGLVMRNVTIYTTDRFQEALIPLRGPSALRLLDRLGLGWAPTALSLLISGVVLVGLLSRLRWRPTVVELGFVFYMLGMFVWPTTPKRYMHPALPFEYLYLLLGAQVLWAWLVARMPPGALATRAALAGPILGVGLLAVVLLGNVGRTAYLWYSPAHDRYPDLRIGATWLAEHSPPDTVVMTTFPVQRYLYTHRKTVNWPLTSEGGLDAVLAYLAANRASYVLVAPIIDQTQSLGLEPETRDIDEIMRAHPERFKQVFSDDEHNVRVYQVLG
jgi:hypothetical protein